MKQLRRPALVWLVRVLVVLSLALPIGLTPGTVSAAPDGQARSVDFFAAVESGQISYVARGRGVASGPMVELTLTNLSTEDLNVLLPPASRFVPSGAAGLTPARRAAPGAWSH